MLARRRAPVLLGMIGMIGCGGPAVEGEGAARPVAAPAEVGSTAKTGAPGPVEVAAPAEVGATARTGAPSPVEVAALAEVGATAKAGAPGPVEAAVPAGPSAQAGTRLAPSVPVFTAAVEGAPVHPPVFTLPTPVDAATIAVVDPGWSEALVLDREVQLERLAGGVLARIGGAGHEIGPDGAFVAQPGVFSLSPRLIAGMGDVLGVWPTDAWRYFSLEERTRSDRAFYKWRGGNRWVAQPLDRTGYDGDAIGFHRWTPRGGLLLGSNDNLVRLAGKYGPVSPLPIAAGYITDAFESVGGTLFVFVASPDPDKQRGLDILRSCKQDGAPGCERSGGAALPVGPGGDSPYRTGAMAARGKWSITAAITESTGSSGPEHHYLVHYETDGWKLEAAPGDARVLHLLAAGDGGLWITLADGEGKESLWHRSDLGVWAALKLPDAAAGMRTVQVALRDEARVWIAANAGDHHAIYSAAAKLPSAELAPHG